MSPDTWENLARIAKFVVASTVVYIVFVVAWAWMKSDETALDREAEAFEAGYEAGRRRNVIAHAWQNYVQKREEQKRDRQS
jgi:hypothetical protein